MDESGLNPACTAIETCVTLGVKEYVICSGARNSALIAAISSLSGVEIYHHPEERSASYFALGMAIKSEAPVAVLTTSGTAAAELLPAVIEAHYQAIPLVLLTADRPVRFRGKGAPQAIVQHEIFGVYAESVANWKGSGPLHINVPLEEPTPDQVASVPQISSVQLPETALNCASDEDTKVLQDFLNKGDDFTVMVGCLPLSWRDDVKDFLSRLNVPVLAEATSGLREDFPFPSIDDGAERVLRIGGVPAVRAWRDLEERERVEVLSVAPNGLPGLARDSSVIKAPHWDSLIISGSLKGISANYSSLDALVGKYPLSEQSWVRRLSEFIPEGSLVFLGNSQPIREWNIAATRSKRGLRCFANRGANGIDGSVSTFLGLAAQEEQAWAIVGDLTAVYDLAAPWIVGQLPATNRRIVVINNGGGRIFRRLSALKGFSVAQMKLVENSHELCFKGWAEMWGMAYRRVTEVRDLEDLPDGFLLMELIPDITQSDDFWAALDSL